jgi:hypothetical protein
MLSLRRSHIALLAVAGALVAAGAAAPGASAAEQRYASPSGAGNDCSSTYPCNIVWAIQGAKAGDEVIVMPGDYSVAYTIENQAPVSIHGVAGQPRPTLYLASGTQLRLKDVKLTYAEVVGYLPGPVAVAAWNSDLNQVIVRGGPQADCAAAIFDGRMRNSIVVARNPSGNAICSQSFQGQNASTYLNVTAIAKDGVAIEAYAFDATATVNLHLVNVIAKAGPNGASLSAATGSLDAHATIVLVRTNFANYREIGPNGTVIAGPDSQNIAPTFVDAAGGDYRQQAASATVDAGVSWPDIGTEDVEGDRRSVGPIDIGADEFVAAPAASTGPASAVTRDAATLAGIVNPKGSATSYHFEYGTSTVYGSSTTSSDAGFGLSDVSASAGLAGLSPDTTYHYRIVASNPAGPVHGSDQTFTTAPAAPGTPTSPSGTFAGVQLVSSRLALKGRFIVVKLRCPAATPGGCTGVTKLTARRRRTRSRVAATVTLGRTGFSIAAGGQTRVRVRASRAGRRLLAQAHRLRGRASNAAHDGAGRSRTTVARVTIRF